MSLPKVDIVTQQSMIDYWMGCAINDPVVRPYLGWYNSITPIELPEDDWDGLVLMDEDRQGLLKMTFDRELMHVKLSIWVRQHSFQHVRAKTTAALTLKFCDLLEEYHGFTRVKSRVKVTNDEGMMYSQNLLGPPWGVEPFAAYDSTVKEVVGVAHFSNDASEVRSIIRSKLLLTGNS